MTTEVFLVARGFDYESEDHIGLYSSMEKALTAANKIKDADTVSIYGLEIDYDYNYSPPCYWEKRVDTGKVTVGGGFEIKKE
jgi:hypothetical protein